MQCIRDGQEPEKEGDILRQSICQNQILRNFISWENTTLELLRRS